MVGLTPTHSFQFYAKINTLTKHIITQKMLSSVLSVDCSLCYQILNRQKQVQYWNWELFLIQYVLLHRQKKKTKTIRHLNKCFHMYIHVHVLGLPLVFWCTFHFWHLLCTLYPVGPYPVNKKKHTDQYQCQPSGNSKASKSLGHKDIPCSWEQFGIQGEWKHLSNPFHFRTCNLWLKALRVCVFLNSVQGHTLASIPDTMWEPFSVDRCNPNDTLSCESVIVMLCTKLGQTCQVPMLTDDLAKRALPLHKHKYSK